MNSKRMLGFVLAFSFILQMPVTALAASEPAYEQYRAGSLSSAVEETEYTVVKISTEEDLRRLAENCSLDSWSWDKQVELQKDISLSTEETVSIPSFGGIFEGNGHRISNLEITGTGSAVGLFRYIQENGRVQNLVVEGKVAPEGSKSQVGGIAGVNYGSIINCSFSGSVAGDSEVGGIAGVNQETGEIRRCKSGATILGNHSTGGITGNNHGIMNNCSNSGDINTCSKEVSYELDDITMEKLEDPNSTANVAAHTDSGGIAGLSDGKIYYCSNSGKVGYQHVGYNVGGIVGRLHQGYLQNCTNTGHILGRKDVGGIAGQMEPFLEIQYLSDKLQELDHETDKFLDLLDATHKDLSGYGRQASVVARAISNHLKNANSAGASLAGTANDLWYLYNQELTGMSSDLKKLSDEWNKQGEQGKDDTHSVTVSGNEISLNGNVITVSSGDGVKQPDDMESYRAALEKFGDSAGSHLDAITAATGDRSGGIQDNLDAMNSELNAAFDGLGQLSDILQAGNDTTQNRVDALVEQAKVLRTLISEIRDDLFRYEGISVEDTSDEDASREEVEPGNSAEAAESEAVAHYDTTAFQQGKITLCINQGQIEADTNVGGIVGQIATEYDMDPEDDITITGAESFDIEQTVKAVVRDSRNLGSVTGKKDCAGGIVGKADFGAVISCESYGDVASTGGSNVGGIAGSASYAIRSCYTMGEVSGKNKIGGIAGEGCDIFYSYAYNELKASGERCGAIAGKVKDDGTLYGNYYVTGSVGGIDGIGYQGGATPLSYEEFCSKEGVPKAFSQFTITFMAEGEELASYQCSYGASLSEAQIPAVPDKEGFYGVWPEFDFGHITGNKVLEAQYAKWITSVASQETDDKGRALLLAQGEFYPEAELQLTGEEDVFHVALSDDRGAYHGSVELRVLCEDVDKTSIEVEENGIYKAVPSTVMGSYRVFTMDAPGTFRVTESSGHDTLKLVIPIVCAAAAVLAVVLIAKKVRRRRTGEEEHDSGSTV